MLNKFLEDEKERSADLESKLQESLQKLEQTAKVHADVEKNLQSQLSDTQNSLKELQAVTNQLK